MGLCMSVGVSGKDFAESDEADNAKGNELAMIHRFKVG